MPSSSCFTVSDGFQSLSSLRMDRHTVPLGYTLGWNSGGVKAHSALRHTAHVAHTSAALCGARCDEVAVAVAVAVGPM